MAGAAARVTTMQDTDILKVGMGVLQQESEALLQLASSLDNSFCRAVELLETVKGRVIVTGMGKSGHVARKIAATLASTGTPAFFVHPAEASHGDLGMVTRDDAVIALSNSGNAPELAAIVSYSRRFRIPLIGVTSRAESSLAEQSDLVLLLPPVGEACPLGLAPTTSTTLMMALGDALAVSLLERRNFSAQDFRQFHPGGSLGKGLVKVEDIMHKGGEVPVCPADVSMADAILVMTAKSFGCVGLIDDEGRLLGIVTDGDLRRHMASDLLARRADTIMTRNPKTIRPNALASEALAMMNITDRPFTSLFVLDEEKPVGIIHIHDCLRAGVA